MQIQIPSRLIALLTAFTVIGSSAYAQPKGPNSAMANDPVFEVSNAKSELKVVEKFAKILKLKNRITTVSGFDQEVISVSKVDRSPNMIRIHAEAPGVTSVVIADEAGKHYTIEVFVIGDVRHLQAYLNKLFPHAAVTAVAIKDTVVLRGWVTQPEQITEMREIAEQFYAKVIDQMKVGGVQQVQLKVRVMEVQRSKIRRMGFNFLYINQNGGWSSTPGPLTPLQQFTNPFNAAPTISVAGLADPTMAFAILQENNVFQGFVEALKQESLLKILAEPELVTTNGRPANMLAGGEFPVLVPQSLGTTTIEWKQFGVRLEAVPIILGRGRVRLELQPEVSERDFNNSVTVGGQVVPGITTRRVNTQVEMRFGETFMLAGLLSMRTTATTSKVPVLGELPWIGAAFRRIRYEKGETELVIMVTPELVAPMNAGQIPPGGIGRFTEDPTDRELFIDGKLETTRYRNTHSPYPVVDSVFGNSSTPQLHGVSPIVPSAPGTNGTSLPVPPMPNNNRTTAPNNGVDFPTEDRSTTQPLFDRSTTQTSIGSGRGVAVSNRSYRSSNRTEPLWDDSRSAGNSNSRFVQPRDRFVQPVAGDTAGAFPAQR